MKRFVSEMRLEAPLDRVWSFYIDPSNLPRITLPHMRLRLARAETPLRQGARIVFSVGRGPMKTVWESVIEEFDPPRLFTDVQVKGPFRLWRHRHEFEANGNGTRVRDTIEFAPPTGFFGRMAAALFLDHEIHELFRHREAVTRKLLEGQG